MSLNPGYLHVYVQGQGSRVSEHLVNAMIKEGSRLALHIHSIGACFKNVS